MTDQFTIDISKWVAKVKDRSDQLLRAVALGLLRSVVMKSPVGNPELWAANSIAAEYNAEVGAHNAALRTDPANLDRRGHLKPGRALDDGMKVNAPDGYRGGRFRANWSVSIGSPNNSIIDAVDAKGDATIAAGEAVLAAVVAGQDIYIQNSVPYAIPLEYGHSREQAPAGMVRVTVAELQQIVDEAVRSLPPE